MNGVEFDDLARQATRRSVLGAAATVLAALRLPPAPAAAKSRADGHAQRDGPVRADQHGGAKPQGPCGNGSGKANACKNDKDCCTRFCFKQRCRCQKTGKPCTDDRNCCPDKTGNACVLGSCRPACDVCPSGCAFDSVQDALAAAAVGATIIVCAGTYTGNLVISKSVTLIGQGDGDGAGDTIVKRSDAPAVIEIDSAAAVVAIRNLRIDGSANVRPARGGIVNNAALTLTDVAVVGNSLTSGPIGGGGILNSSDLTAVRLTVAGNTAFGGGGIANNRNGTVTLTDSVVSDNVARELGGGIYSAGGQLALHNTAVTGNHAGFEGGGIYVNFNATVTLTDCVVSDNTSDNIAGGIANARSQIALHNTAVTGNHAGFAGGGIVNGAGATGNCADGSTVSGNTAGEPPVASNCIDTGGGTGCGSCPETAAAGKKRSGGTRAQSGKRRSGGQ